jgi:hypothetical protein
MCSSVFTYFIVIDVISIVWSCHLRNERKSLDVIKYGFDYLYVMCIIFSLKPKIGAMYSQCIVLFANTLSLGREPMI